MPTAKKTTTTAKKATTSKVIPKAKSTDLTSEKLEEVLAPVSSESANFAIGQEEVVVSNEEPVVSAETTPAVDNSPMNNMLAMMQQMQEQMAAMASELSETKKKLAESDIKLEEAKAQQFVAVNGNGSVNVVPAQEYMTPPVQAQVPVYQQPVSQSDRFLEILAGRKADREVTIVHNREMTSGASTHLKLGNLEIDMRTLGETRVLTWSQFEQCASKYRNFFKKQIILVADENRDVAEEYNLPCVKRSDGITLTRADLNKLPRMTTSELEKLYNSLTDADKEFMLSYWLGQCYSRAEGFYDRYKVEFLNHLSKKNVFENILALMNGDFTRNNGSTIMGESGNTGTTVQKPNYIKAEL